MERETGSRDYPIWLIGDSSPKRWEPELRTPLDSRHPARHIIWTPVLEQLQLNLYASIGKRLQTDDLYIRNAVHNSSDKPENSSDWSSNLNLKSEIRQMSELLHRYKPTLLFSFGEFAFEFTRRSLNKSPIQASWSIDQLGNVFSKRIEAFNPKKINVIPLLHAIIARGEIIENHRKFTKLENGNYYDFVGQKIADCLVRNQTVFPLW